MAHGGIARSYTVSGYACRARGVATNTCPMAPYRGVSRPVITFTLERLMDKAAAAFGIDPVDIRRRNLIRKFPYASADRPRLRRGELCGDAWTWRSKPSTSRLPGTPESRARADGRYLGLGIVDLLRAHRLRHAGLRGARHGDRRPAGRPSTSPWTPPVLSRSRIGASPHGQGLRTTLAQLVADELGIAPEHIKIVHGDTDRTPYGWGTFASRSLVIAGGATPVGGAQGQRQAAGHGRPSPRSRGRGHRAGTMALPGLPAPIARSPSPELARTAYHQSHRFRQELAPGLREAATYDPAGDVLERLPCGDRRGRRGNRKGRRSKSCLVAEDAGRLINPMIADGQIAGGVAQGIANALLEEILYDERGNILTATFADYLLPTAREMPPIDIHHLRDFDPSVAHQGQGFGRGRQHRRAGRGRQRDQRRARALQRLDRRDPRDPAAHPRGVARRIAACEISRQEKGNAHERNCVIPGRRSGAKASPESILLGRGHGFPGCRASLGPRNDGGR